MLRPHRLTSQELHIGLKKLICVIDIINLTLTRRFFPSHTFLGYVKQKFLIFCGLPGTTTY